MKFLYLKSILVFVVMTAVMAWLHLGGNSADADESHQRTLNVEYVTLQPIEHQVVVKAWGLVEPWEETGLSSQVAGKVISMHPRFELGGIIKKGSVVFELDQADYLPAVRAAEADLALAKAQLDEEAAQGGVAKVQWQGRKATDLALRKPQLAAAKARVESAEANLVEARRDLSRTKIIAPFDAVVRTRDLGVGQVISASQVVGTLFNATKARLVLPVAMFDLPFLQAALQTNSLNSTNVEIQLMDASNRKITRNASLQGDLAFVDEKTRMQQLMVVIDDPYLLNSPSQAGRVIRFGSYVEATLPGHTLQQVFEVPQHLVSNAVLWVVDNNQQLQPREVEVVREEGVHVYVAGGLQHGDRLVVTLPDYPVAGTSVTATESTLLVSRENGS